MTCDSISTWKAADSFYNPKASVSFANETQKSTLLIYRNCKGDVREYFFDCLITFISLNLNEEIQFIFVFWGDKLVDDIIIFPFCLYKDWILQKNEDSCPRQNGPTRDLD